MFHDLIGWLNSGVLTNILDMYVTLNISHDLIGWLNMKSNEILLVIM